MNESVELSPYGFAFGYYLYPDGSIWSTRQRGKPDFKNIDYTGCTLLKLADGRYARKSVKLLVFQVFVIPELLKQGYVPIFDGEAYINNEGDVFSSNIGERLVWNLAHKYYYVHISGKYRLVHRLVAQTFLPNPENLPEVDHIDGNKSNNYVGNLRWTDRSGNMKSAYEMGALDESLAKAQLARRHNQRNVPVSHEGSQLHKGNQALYNSSHHAC